MSSATRSGIGNNISAINNEGFPQDIDSLRDLTIRASRAWHENERCEHYTHPLCAKMAKLTLPETLRLLSDFIDIDPKHGACLIGALRRYITLHYSQLLPNVEQSIVALHESFAKIERKSDEQRLAYEVLIYERAMVEKRRKYNIPALNLMSELRRIISVEHKNIPRDDLLHQLFTFPLSPMAYVDLQNGLLRSRLGYKPNIIVGEEDIDMTRSIRLACDEVPNRENTDFRTASKIRYFVFMKILIHRDRVYDNTAKLQNIEPWESIENIARDIAMNCSTNIGLVRLMKPVLINESSGSGKIRDEHLDKLRSVKEQISRVGVDKIHRLLRETVGDISLNNPLKTDANKDSNLSFFERSLHFSSGRPQSSRSMDEGTERRNFSVESMSNGIPKIINTNNALIDAVFANSLRWEKISKPAKRTGNEKVNIAQLVAKSTGHLIKIDTSLGSEFSDIAQAELDADKNVRTDFVGVLNQYMSGYQPLTYLSEEKTKSGRRKNLKISKTTKMNRISAISTCVKGILNGLESEGYLLSKDIPTFESDRYNLLILPQRFKDSWTLETLNYTLLFNSLHLNRLVTHWHIGRTMVSTTSVSGVYKSKLSGVMDKIGVLLVMELLHGLTVLSIRNEAGGSSEDNVADWLRAMVAEITEAGAVNDTETEQVTWKHPSYKRMFDDTIEVTSRYVTSKKNLATDLANALFLVVRTLGEDVIQGVPRDVSELNSTELIKVLETLRKQHLDNLTNKEHNFSPQKILATRLTSARLVQDFLDAQE